MPHKQDAYTTGRRGRSVLALLPCEEAKRGRFAYAGRCRSQQKAYHFGDRTLAEGLASHDKKILEARVFSTPKTVTYYHHFSPIMISSISKDKVEFPEYPIPIELDNRSELNADNPDGGVH